MPFRYAGIVTEFPTAPRDSFFVANAGYVAARTGSDAVGAFLVDTGGRDVTGGRRPHPRPASAPAATVTDIATHPRRRRIQPDRRRPHRPDPRRTRLRPAPRGRGRRAGARSSAWPNAAARFAIATALGATGHQLRRLVTAEAVVLAVGGLAAGAGVGWALSQVLVAVLTGVFDPPPAGITVPWVYLGCAAAVTVGALALAAEAGPAAQPPPRRFPMLREL